VLERWTRGVLRHRALVLGCWLAVVVVGIAAAARLPALLSTSFAVPGTESAQANALLASGFGERPEGTFVVVWDAPGSSAQLRSAFQRRLAAAARTVPTGQARRLRDGGGVVYGEIATSLRLARAKGYTDGLRRTLAAQGAPRAWVTGQPAIQHDVDPLLRQDLRRAELVAVPVALAILAAVLGLSLAVVIPLVFAACTITATLALVWVVAQWSSVTTYVPALVELVGLGLAIDYSLLVVHRFREEVGSADTRENAVVRTMATAGRAIVVSGVAVAVGLALLLFVPVPLIRSLGIGGFLVPLVSIAGVLTLQPVLLSALGGNPDRARQRARSSRGWARAADAVVGRPWPWLVAGTAALALAAAPIAVVALTPGSFSSLPRGSDATDGFARLTDAVGPGAVSPTQIVVDTGSAGGVGTVTRAAVNRLVDRLVRDPEVYVVASGRRPPYVDGSRRRTRVVVVARHEYGTPEARALVRRIRDEFVPGARFPAADIVVAGGAPPQGVDFVDRAYGAFPWVVLAVLAVTFAVLLRAFRSVVLPFEAVVLNLLTVAAVCGLLVAVFQWGAGRVVGLQQTDGIEAWVPIFLFATLFGLSMDYEVFLVSRMREAWDEKLDNAGAITSGIVRSGPVVTAAAAIMVVAFAGFVSGRIVGLQQLGLGLAVGILIDATIVRMLVLPALMAVVGQRNWWLPPRVARLARVEPSPVPR
jgi:RND superfamily putative drug exporter